MPTLQSDGNSPVRPIEVFALIAQAETSIPSSQRQMSGQRPKFPVVVRCYNEEDALPAAIIGLREALSEQDDYELIVVASVVPASLAVAYSPWVIRSARGQIRTLTRCDCERALNRNLDVSSEKTAAIYRGCSSGV